MLQDNDITGIMAEDAFFQKRKDRENLFIM
jgi:hypothetical protein